jgi:hypothetical protein
MLHLRKTDTEFSYGPHQAGYTIRTWPGFHGENQNSTNTFVAHQSVKLPVNQIIRRSRSIENKIQSTISEPIMQVHTKEAKTERFSSTCH